MKNSQAKIHLIEKLLDYSTNMYLKERTTKFIQNIFLNFRKLIFFTNFLFPIYENISLARNFEKLTCYVFFLQKEAIHKLTGEILVIKSFFLLKEFFLKNKIGDLHRFLKFLIKKKKKTPGIFPKNQFFYTFSIRKIKLTGRNFLLTKYFLDLNHIRNMILRSLGLKQILLQYLREFIKIFIDSEGGNPLCSICFFSRIGKIKNLPTLRRFFKKTLLFFCIFFKSNRSNCESFSKSISQSIILDTIKSIPSCWVWNTIVAFFLGGKNSFFYFMLDRSFQIYFKNGIHNNPKGWGIGATKLFIKRKIGNSVNLLFRDFQIKIAIFTIKNFKLLNYIFNGCFLDRSTRRHAKSLGRYLESEILGLENNTDRTEDIFLEKKEKALLLYCVKIFNRQNSKNILYQKKIMIQNKKFRKNSLEIFQYSDLNSKKKLKLFLLIYSSLFDEIPPFFRSCLPFFAFSKVSFQNFLKFFFVKIFFSNLVNSFLVRKFYRKCFLKSETFSIITISANLNFARIKKFFKFINSISRKVHFFFDFSIAQNINEIWSIHIMLKFRGIIPISVKALVRKKYFPKENFISFLEKKKINRHKFSSGKTFFFSFGLKICIRTFYSFLGSTFFVFYYYNSIIGHLYFKQDFYIELIKKKLRIYLYIFRRCWGKKNFSQNLKKKLFIQFLFFSKKNFSDENYIAFIKKIFTFFYSDSSLPIERLLIRKAYTIPIIYSLPIFDSSRSLLYEEFTSSNHGLSLFFIEIFFSKSKSKKKKLCFLKINLKKKKFLKIFAQTKKILSKNIFKRKKKFSFINSAKKFSRHSPWCFCPFLEQIKKSFLGKVLPIKLRVKIIFSLLFQLVLNFSIFELLKSTNNDLSSRKITKRIQNRIFAFLLSFDFKNHLPKVLEIFYFLSKILTKNTISGNKEKSNHEITKTLIDSFLLNIFEFFFQTGFKDDAHKILFSLLFSKFIPLIPFPKFNARKVI